MNETFNFKRFFTYFKYDLKQMWRNHAKAAILIGGSGAILYILWVLFGLVFTQQWHGAPFIARVVMLVVAFAILEIYQARTYGHLTDKKAGSNWLMIPASKTEKFVSMLLVTLVVIPILFFAVYLVLDGFLSLVDPTFGQSIANAAIHGADDLSSIMAEIRSESPITFTSGSFIFLSLLGFVCNFMYFLLCGICFKKNKIVGAIAILFLLSTVMSLLSALVVPHFAQGLMDSASEAQFTHALVNLMNGSVIFSVLLTLGIGWGIWYRIKTLQH